MVWQFSDGSRIATRLFPPPNTPEALAYQRNATLLQTFLQRARSDTSDEHFAKRRNSSAQARETNSTHGWCGGWSKPGRMPQPTPWRPEQQWRCTDQKTTPSGLVSRAALRPCCAYWATNDSCLRYICKMVARSGNRLSLLQAAMPCTIVATKQCSDRHRHD
jgi:hypothetical protein